MPSRATPATPISASGQPVIGRPPPLGGLGGLETGPGEGWWCPGLGVTVAVGVGVGDPVGDGEHEHPDGGGEGHPELHPGGDEGHPELHPDGDDEGVSVGDGIGVHATQNTFCLARPFSPVKFHSSL